MVAKQLPFFLVVALFVAACAFLAAPSAAQDSEPSQQAPAEQPAPKEDPGLKEVLNELLRGGDDAAPAPVPQGRRLPFGRTEIQLSFAPLVKETAPAVVNVYASQQVRMRSPFAGDPFFEQFFG
ncbi:MAG: serine protease, partial [Pseudaminobacter sp.]